MKTMDHKAYPARCRRMTESELRFTIADARAALDAMPEGRNAGYYADEICYAADELNSRKNNSRRRASPADHKRKDY